MADTSLKGKLLVANPRFSDPNFDRTVVWLLSHDTEGAAGVVINRASPISLIEPVPQLEDMAAYPAVLFDGGPVGQDMAICVGRCDDPGALLEEGGPGAWQQIEGSMGLVSLDVEPASVRQSMDTVRIFMGYAGWGPEQLEQELLMESWFVVEVEAFDLFSPDPDNLWLRVLRRQGGNLAIVSAFPPDPSAN